MTLPKIGHNRTILLGIVASAIPLTIIMWGFMVGLGKTVDAQDVALIIGVLGGPIGFLSRRGGAGPESDD